MYITFNCSVVIGRTLVRTHVPVTAPWHPPSTIHPPDIQHCRRSNIYIVIQSQEKVLTTSDTSLQVCHGWIRMQIRTSNTDTHLGSGSVAESDPLAVDVSLVLQVVVRCKLLPLKQSIRNNNVSDVLVACLARDVTIFGVHVSGLALHHDRSKNSITSVLEVSKQQSQRF